jgi:hypothetical protein
LIACIEYISAGPWYGALADDETLRFYDPSMQARWDEMALKDRALWLTGQLWNCSDILPGGACSELDLPAGSTYAVAARMLRAELT